MQNDVQLTHETHQRSNNKFPLCIIANDITDPLNVGSLFRICDALGIEKLYLCGDTPTPPNAKINKTSRSTEKYVSFEKYENAEVLAAALKNTAHFIISLEITSSSIPIDEDEFNKSIEKKDAICLVLGSENTGVSEALLSLSDISVHIPMYGNNSSMNVVTAASITAYEITRIMKNDMSL